MEVGDCVAPRAVAEDWGEWSFWPDANPQKASCVYFENKEALI